MRSGNTPRTKHPYTIRNHLNAVFAHLQTLADIGISKQAHLTHPAALHTAWQNTRHATIKHLDADLLASIDMLQPNPAHRGSHFRPFWLTAEQEE